MKVLVIEDEPGITTFLKQGLNEEGYEVITASDGSSGYTLALDNKPDIILLDWMLPKMNGIEVCKKIREHDKNVPILFLTAKDTVQETIEGLRVGANDYIKKPFSFDELLARIDVHLRYNENNEKLVIGSVTILLTAHKVYKGNTEVNLTQREFELLAYLIMNKGKVCTRKQIINDIWNIHFEYDTGVIDVFINAIRKKLDLNKDEDFIRAVRGIGYIAEIK